ncbi:MAG: radical SAM protein [Gaiellales bacterium]
MTPAGDVRSAVDAAVAGRRMGGRPWLSATYHCNLRCSYCLTESSPRMRDRRELAPERMVGLVAEAAPLGFGRVGVTGGEVFMLPGMGAALAGIAGVLPTTALTNGTLVTDRLLQQLAPLAGHHGFALQLSLDSADAAGNDGLRGPGNFARVRVGAAAPGAGDPRAPGHHGRAPDTRRAGTPLRPAPQLGDR